MQPAKTRLRELTNIGSELVALGRLAPDQLVRAQRVYAERKLSAPDVRFGAVLLELGFVTAEDLDVAERSQQASRNTMPENHVDSRDALKNLLKLVHVHERTSSTASRMRSEEVNDAVAAAMASAAAADKSGQPK